MNQPLSDQAYTVLHPSFSVGLGTGSYGFPWDPRGGLLKFFITTFAFMVGLSGVALSQQPVAPAQSSADVSALEKKIQDLEDRMVMLEGQIRQLKAAQPSPSPAPA